MTAPRAPSATRKGWPVAAIRNDLNVLARLAGPVVISRLGIMAMGLTDALVVGQYSAIQLSYQALGWAPTSVMLTVAIGLLSGVPVMTSRAIGAGDRHLAGAVLRRGLVYATWMGGAATALLIGLGPLLLHSIGLDRHLADGATGVMIVLSLSLIPNALSTALGMWLEALSKPSPAMTMMWLANILNLVIDLILVPGRFGAPALGATGAACATLGARIALTLGLAIYIMLMPEARALGVFDKPKRDKAAETEQRRVGFGAGASSFFEVAAFASMNVVAGWVGALSIAAYTVALNVISIIFMVPLGLSAATGVMVGSAYGARDHEATNRVGLVGVLVAASFGLLVSAIVWPTARLIVSGYTHDPKVEAMAAGALTLCCLFLIPDAIQVVVAQSLRARGDVWVPSASHLVSYALVMIPLAYVFALPLHMGVNGIIWAAIIATLVSAGLLLGRFWMLSRRASA